MRFLRRLRLQDGSALVIALGMLVVLGLSATTIAYYSTSNAGSATASKHATVAFTLAEAGLNNALSVLTNVPPNDPMDPSLLAQRNETYENGTVTWWGVLDTPNAKWTITSIGYAKNPTGSSAAQLKHTLTAKVPIRPVATQPLSVQSWNYVYSWGTGDTSGCDMTLDSSVQIDTRIMTNGNLCLRSSSKITGGDVLVGGQTKTFNSALIGSSTTPINRIDSTNGCSYSTNPVHNPCQGPPANADKVWATTITSSPALEPAPGVDLDGWYVKASPGPYKPCESPTGTPPAFDNDQGSTPDITKRNRSVAGSFNLTPSSSYTCQTSLGGEPLGELSWNHLTKVLTVRGTIFIDGNARIEGQGGSYTGQGTLYLSGSFFINGQKMCAVVQSGSSCNFSAGAWDPNTRLLTIVANGDGGQSGVDAGVSVALSSSTEWQGAIYGGAYKITVESSLKFSGPLIADEVWLGSSLQGQPFTTIGTAPTGMPGNSTVYAKPDKLELFSG